MKETDSVAAYFLRALIYKLGANGQKTAAVLISTGIDPNLMSDPTARVPAKAFASLWLAQINCLRDEFFGLDSHGMPLGSFALICRALIQEPDLYKALSQCLKNLSLFLKDFRGKLRVQNTRAFIVVESNTRDEAACRLGEETFLVLVVSLMCWLSGRRIPIKRAAFRSHRIPLADDAGLWGDDVIFGASQTAIEFDSLYLQLPVVQNLSSLKNFLRTAPGWLVIRYRAHEGLTSLVYKRFRDTDYKSWPTLHEFAVQQHMSASTFRRRLECEGYSYQQIKNEVRRIMAIEHLCKRTKSISEVAEICGFQETSAFHRAFKKWTDKSPGQFRQAKLTGKCESEELVRIIGPAIQKILVPDS